MGRAVTASLGQSIARAEQAEAQISRLTRLRRMSAAQLARLFADPASAAPWVEAAAACGIPEAQVRLGRMLLEGTGTARDEKAAMRWFLKAARTGHGDHVLTDRRRGRYRPPRLSARAFPMRRRTPPTRPILQCQTCR